MDKECPRCRRFFPRDATHWYLTERSSRSTDGIGRAATKRLDVGPWCKECTKELSRERSKFDTLYSRMTGKRCDICGVSLTRRRRDRDGLCADCLMFLDDVAWDQSRAQARWIESKREIDLEEQLIRTWPEGSARRAHQANRLAVIGCPHKLCVLLEPRYREIAQYLARVS